MKLADAYLIAGVCALALLVGAGQSVSVAGACGVLVLLGTGLLELRWSGWLQRVRVPLRGLCVGALIVLLWGVPNAWDRVVQEEGWYRELRRTQARWEMEQRPTVFPRVLTRAHPQRLYVRTGACEEFQASLMVGDEEVPLPSLSLDRSVHRLNYDPELLWGKDLGPQVALRLQVDGKETVRMLEIPAEDHHVAVLRKHAQRVGWAAGVSEGSDSLFIFGAGGLRATPYTGDGPSACVVGDDPRGNPRVWVVHRFEPVLLEYDLELGEVVRVFKTEPWQSDVALSPSGKYLAVTIAGREGALRIIELATGVTVRRIVLPSRPDHVVFGRSDQELVLASRQSKSLMVVDWDEEGESALEVDTLRPARQLARTVDGDKVFFTSGGYSTHPLELLGNHQVHHQLVGFDVADRRVIELWDLAKRSLREDSPGLSRGIDPYGISVSAAGVWVSFTGSAEVAFWDFGREGARTWLSLREMGVRVPQGVVHWEGGGGIVSDPAEDRFLFLDADGSWDTVPLKGDPLVREGQLAFHAATRQGISCQSCHLDAHTDFSFYNIGSGVRMVPTLRGIHTTAPYLREGAHDSIAGLHEDLAMGLLAGYFGNVDADERGRALDAWVTRLPARPNPHGEDLDAATLQAGYAVFQQVGCADCHAPPTFTNQGQVFEKVLFPNLEDVPPRRQLDVPSLIGVWERNAWLLDGRAKSIEAVFRDWNPGDHHGRTAQLTDEEMDLLLQFIRSL